MASKRDIIEEIRSNLKIITQFKPEYLTQQNKGGLDFSNITKEIIAIISNSKLLLQEFEKNYDFCMEFSEKRLLELKMAVQNIIASLKSIRNFIDKVFGSLPNSLDVYLESNLRKEINSIIIEFTSAHNDFENETNVLIQNITLEKENVQYSLRSEKTAISQYTTLFDNRIRFHFLYSIGWLVAFFLMLYYSGSFLFCLMSDYNLGLYKFQEGDYLNFFDHVALRLILLSLAGYVLHFLSKGYSLNKNQELLYEDKRTALRSFDYFLDSSRDDKDLHRLILLQVTNTIFANRPNGYLDKTDGPLQSQFNIKEAVDLLNSLKEAVKK